MRELLYQGKQVDGRCPQWVIGWYFCEEGKHYILPTTFLPSANKQPLYVIRREVIPESLMQSTGFTMDGAHIWEGDIFYDETKDVKGVVTFGCDSPTGFFVKWPKGCPLRTDLGFWADANTPVVGNVIMERYGQKPTSL